MSHNNYFNNLNNEQIIKQIETLKKQNKNSNEWKVQTILFVTNFFDRVNKEVEIVYYDGKFQPLFKKIKLTFSEFVQYVDDIKNSDIYDDALAYIKFVTPILRDEEIKMLENRVSSGVMTKEEMQHQKVTRLSKTLTKVIAVVIIFAAIYVVLVMLLSLFGYSFK